MKKVFISMACVLIALSGCTNGGSNKESMEVVLNIKRKVKPECVSALKESFLKCKESTLLEPGCIGSVRKPCGYVMLISESELSLRSN
ncbi:antibiotic biosynthesis monooxygenase [Parabacteroides distasonis]|uniref:antibiotic biosynthesis monooxygenase n=1 Tax=Parabacteroides distasonis TaxID=823 RepID=UPI001E59AE38|nr:antibiotic biosynthesis monooxygenase [Parabacteroides distasonis]